MAAVAERSMLNAYLSAVELHRRSDGLSPSLEWEFVRFLKAEPEFAGLSAREALETVETCLSEAEYDWAELFPGRDFKTREAASATFVDLWQTVKLPANMSVVDAALAMADSKPLKLLNEFTPTFVRLMSLAAWLQDLRGTATIQLPVHTLAAKLEVDAATVSRWRKVGVREGLLVHVRKYHHGPDKIQNRADDFRFALDRFDGHGTQLR